MAGTIQRLGARTNLIGLKSLLGIGTKPGTSGSLNSYCRLYSASAVPVNRIGTESAQFGAVNAVILSNTSLPRLPLRAPPIINQRLIIDYKIPSRLPTSTPTSEILDKPSDPGKSIEAPNSPGSIVEKQAARLIVIRRIKMNKHKLKKRRRKLKYLLQKIKTRREMRKEKEFLNSLMAKIREADKFDAKTYVSSIIAKAKEKPPVVMFWKGTPLPDWLVKEKLAEKAAAEQREYLSILDKRDQGKLKKS